MERRERGKQGEQAAERMLRRAGLVILARNWRGAGGELDLTALEGNTLVFCEVKSRARGFADPHPAVSHAQQQRIARAASAFRSRFGVRDLPCRFDLITVAGDPRGAGDLTWHKHYQRNQ